MRLRLSITESPFWSVSARLRCCRAPLAERTKKTIDSVIGNVFILTLLMSSAVTVLGYIFAPQLLHLVRAEGEMHELGVKYLRIVYLGSIFVNFGQAANMVIRGEGKMAL